MDALLINNVERRSETMKNVTAVQVFAVLAIVVGLLVSYQPPIQNAAAIFGLVGTFFGFAMKDLFSTRSTGDDLPNVSAPADGAPSTTLPQP